MGASLTGENKKLGAIALLTCIVALADFFIPADRHSLHIILHKLYFISPVLAAVWFGFRGSMYAALAVSALFSLHALLDWPGNHIEQVILSGELVSFWVVGLIAGIEREQSFLRGIARANEETLVGLVFALDQLERGTRLHSQRVRAYTLLLADRFGLDEGKKRVIGFGALLHDVGKIGIPDSILSKPGRLTEEERKVMRDHPSAGYGIVCEVGFPREAAEIVHAHHERFDGSGYPQGLKEEDIPIGARLFAVADVYDALTSPRPYRAPLSHEDALFKIREKSGSHFDRTVVHVFESIAPELLQSVSEKYRDSGLEGEMRRHNKQEVLVHIDQKDVACV
jgi:putative nucleotidyltransferase with HDIG domain